jgi:S1-C subfamily serine protease
MRALGFLLLGLLAAAPARADEVERPTLQLLDSIVRVRAEIPREARTAAALDTERIGSGVVIDDDGLIVTIGFLITEATGVEVTAGGRPVPADVVGFDGESGLGLVRARGKLGVKPVPLGRSADLKEHARVLVASFGGGEHAVGAYVVSRRPFTGYWEYILDDAIFTAPAHPEWTGAALLGADGRLLGIGYLAVPNADGGALPLPGNMFVPIDRLKPVMADLLAMGRPSTPPRPWMGIRAHEIEGHIVVISVQPESPAEKAGVEPGDLVVEFDGAPVETLTDLYRRLWAKGSAGVEARLTLLDRRGPREVRVRTMDRYKFLKLGVTY